MIPTSTFFLFFLLLIILSTLVSLLWKSYFFPPPHNLLLCFTGNQQTSCSYAVYFYILASCSSLVVIHDILYSFMMTLDSFPEIYLYSLPKECVEDSTILATLNFWQSHFSFLLNTCIGVKLWVLVFKT